MDYRKYRKAITAAIAGALSVAIAVGWLTPEQGADAKESIDAIALAIVALGGTFGVWAVPNKGE